MPPSTSSSDEDVPPRRLALVGPAYPFRGGIAHFTDAMARGFRERGHRVDVFTFSRQYPELLFPGKSQYEREEGRSETAARVIDSVNPLTWLRAGRQIGALRPDAVVFQYWLPFFGPAYGTVAARVRRHAGPDTRVIAVAHNVLPHERRPGDVALGRYFLKKCDAIVALSASVAADAQLLGVDASIRTLSHPVYEHFGRPRAREEARRALGLPADAEVMLFFGFVREYKGLRVLLEAMPQIARARPDVHLVVAGEFYDDESPYRELIRLNRLEDRVHLFSDYVPEGEVPVYFSAADVVVQPYRSATQSGVVQTAFHFERPVIVTDVGGLAEVVPHERAGLVVPPDDPSALATAVVRYFQEGMAESLTAGVRDEREMHGWGAFLAEIEKEFD